jgi:hypothetical protein
MFPSVKRKFAGKIIYPQRFFQFSGWKNIPSWGAGEHGKFPACGKKLKEHLHPL